MEITDSTQSAPRNEKRVQVHGAALRNLGNTGWMNTGIQCTRGMKELTYYFLGKKVLQFDSKSHILIEGIYKTDLNPNNPLGYYGEVAEAYATLLVGLSNTASGSTFAPREFKTIVSKWSPSFSSAGRTQYDAQEFIQFLLDGLHQDLNRAARTLWMEDPEISDEMAHDASAIRELGQKYAAKLRATDDSIITDLCYGTFKNSLKCPTCSKVSITFYPYSMITIDCPIEDTWRLDPSLGAKMREEKSATLEEYFFGIFNKQRILSEIDAWYCPRCKEHKRASHTQEL